MIFVEAALKGAWIIDPEPHRDERGFFARTWCRDELAAHGLCADVAQCSISYNTRRGTLRGLHWQAAPHAEVKIVRCTMGAIHDVIVDLRRDSPTFKQHVAVTLTATNRTMLYVPHGFAHGFQTLEDDSEVLYQISTPYAPSAACGARWDDPAFRIAWPEPPASGRIIAARDLAYADFRDEDGQ